MSTAGITHVAASEMLIRLAAAGALGAAIGFERQWRQRSAGLHTSSLVAIGAALFALLDTIIGSGDTTRIVAGVVTGVGFIAGGVILRTGNNVSGLNTAATIWATAAVGALAGFGLWGEAITGAVAIILLNVLLQPMADAINRRSRTWRIGERVYKVSILALPQSQTAVSAAIIEAVSASSLAMQSLTRQNAEGANVEVRADIFADAPDDAAIEALSNRLLAIAGVDRVDWQVTEP